MKISSIILFCSFCLTHGSDEKGISNESTNSSKPIPKPPYYTNGTATFYYHDPKIEYAKLDIILRQISRNTCLNFTKNGSQINNSIGINFLVSENENNVSLSYSTNRPTNVSLKEDVYDNYKNLSFYIGLALDIIPEIRRYDRFHEVLVNMSYVNKTFKQFFYKTNLSDVPYINGTDFDFGSPMFFSPYFGSKNNQTTYAVKLYKNYQPYYGNGRVFRHNDYKHIAKYYCNISEEQSGCKYGGYTVPYSLYTSRCKCPKYLTGDYCTELWKNTAENCTLQRNITANRTRQFLIVRNASGSCYFNITSSNSSKKVNVTVERLEYETSNCTNGGLYLEVLSRNDKGAKGMHLCRNSTNVKIPSISNTVFVVFNGNDEANFLNISYREVRKKVKEKPKSQKNQKTKKTKKKSKKAKKSKKVIKKSKKSQKKVQKTKLH